MPVPHYFAYGSNMSRAELLAYCPSAHFLGIARLDGWRLDFTVFSQKRQGGVADIVALPVAAELDRPSGDDPADRPRTLPSGAPTANGQPPPAPANPLSPVWGVLWSIPEDELPALDAKEGFDPARPDERNLYRRVDLELMLLPEQALPVGVLTATLQPAPAPPALVRAFAYEVLRKAPATVPPGRAYLELLLRGAREHGLPPEYSAALAAVASVGQ
jgi:hypothetical protein